SLEPPLSYRGVSSPHFHTGLDIGAAANTPVRAAADGVVILATASVDGAGRLVGYGNHVVIAHPDGLVTLYGHLNSLTVQAGDIVRQGQVIGLEGSTGWSTGPHLHFEVRRGTDFLDPRSFLGKQLPA
ncbi:MAG: M23 family metallopeptidase, partial [Candidatus Dormibacteria bacterium]